MCTRLSKCIKLSSKCTNILSKCGKIFKILSNSLAPCDLISCTGDSDSCDAGTCKCGSAAKCGATLSNICTSATCKCGSSTACSLPTATRCNSGTCKCGQGSLCTAGTRYASCLYSDGDIDLSIALEVLYSNCKVYISLVLCCTCR